MMRKALRPIHPGETLREEFLVPLELSASALARKLKVPPNRVTSLLNGTRAFTADTALRLARFFGTTPQFWMNLQTAYDLRSAELESAKKISAEIRPFAKAARSGPARVQGAARSGRAGVRPLRASANQ